MTDEDLRRAFAEARTPQPEAPLAAERIWEAAKGRATPDEVAAVVDALARDPASALAWRLARELPDDPAAGAAATARPANGVRWFALAAGLAAALAVGAWSVRSPGPPEGDGAADPYRGASEVSRLPAIRVAPGEDAVVRWDPVPGARYVVVVSDPELAELGRVEAGAEPEARVPADLLARLPGGVGSLSLRIRTDRGEERWAPSPVVVAP